MKQSLLVLIFGSFTFIAPAQVNVKPSLPRKQTPIAEWPTLRANNNRDGRIASTGEFRNAASLSQSIDYATSEAYIELSPDAKGSSISYQAGTTTNPDLLLSLSTEWQTETRAYLDLNGDGKIKTVSQSQNVKYAKLFNGDNKYYRIEAYDGFGVTSNVNDDIFVGIRVHEGNTDKLVLEKRFQKGVEMQRPHVLVSDMDNDGQQDIIIASWEGIYVFNNKGDSIAGLSQNAHGWHHLRKRGFAAVADVDGNGFKDVVIIGAYPYHVDVIKNNGGVLEFGWTQIFDGHIESAKKISKPILNSVSDFDGDGTVEVLVNVYNFSGDNNWAGILFDATSGRIKAKIEDAYVLSADDVNQDGRYVFFCVRTQGQSVPLVAELKAVSFDHGEIKELLRIERGEWINPRIANTSPTVTTHADGISSLAEDVVLCVDYENTGQKSFFVKTKKRSENTFINSYYLGKDEKVKKGSLAVSIPSGIYGDIIRSRKNQDGSSSLLLQIKSFGTPGGTVQVTGANARDRGRYISVSKKSCIPVVADINSDGLAEIIIPNDVGEVLCFGRSALGILELKWKVPGHGMLFQYGLSIDFGVAVDDIDHDGNKEVIVSGGNEAGAVIFLYDHNGKLLWQRGFPEINAGDMTTFDGNVAFFGTAQSSKRKNRDVIVTVQRVIQHTGKTYSLSGANGSVLWVLDTLTAERGPRQGGPVISGAGGNVFSTYDINGDGSDEVMCGYGNIVFFADSNDGRIEFKAFMRKLFMDKYDYPANGYTSFWMAQILPVAFHRSGQIALSCFNTGVAAATMAANGTLMWCPKELPYDNRLWQCLADLDGDGKLWVVEVSVRSSDKMPFLLAYDPENGSPHKSFSMEMPGFTAGISSVAMPAACDLNGDGRDEIVLSSNSGVYCIGNTDGKVSFLWKYSASGCGPAVIADIDADGFVEVIVATQSGKILIIDK